MKKILQRLLMATTVAAAFVTAGCSDNRASGPATPTVSGIAATGQPIVGQVHLKDSAATPRELTGPTANDGSYTFNVAGLTAPFLVKVDWTASAGPQSLVSFAEGPGTANITPVSHLIVAAAAGGGDPVALYDGTPGARQQLAGAMPGAAASVLAELKPLLDRYEVTIDPITGPFAANHVGLDAMLDAVQISMNTGTVTVINRASGAMIYTAPVSNMSRGVFNHSNMPTPAPGQAQPSMEGAALYDSNCANCHGSLAGSTKKGASVASIQSAITSRIGGMGSLSGLTSQQIQAIVAALAAPAASPMPPPKPAPSPTPTTVDGNALYAAKCAGCHGPSASTNKKGMTLVRLQTAITNNIAGMGTLSSLALTEMQAIVDALAPAITPAPAPTPAPTPTPAPAPVDGASLYATNCAGCHGALATSGKKNITLARLQNSVTGNIGGMGFLSSLTTGQQQAIVDVLTVVAPTPAPTPTPAPAPAPAPVNGTTLYASSCAGCHGALASSGKAGATAARIQNGITSNAGGMGYLSTLTSTEVAAIATALATVAPAPSPAPTPACGSCHALPPSTGQHSKHRSRSCATCHGTGYSTTTVNGATHNNGVKNIVTTTGWNATRRTCANSCHGTETW